LAEVFIKVCPVLENQRLAERTFLMRLQAPEIAAVAKPGQFIMVQTGPGWRQGGPLLRRPFSLHRLGPSGEISLLYRVVGVGTRLMERMDPGDKLEVVGPLGRGFNLHLGDTQAYLAAGGIGLAPMIALAEALTGQPSKFFYGARTSDEVDAFLGLLGQASYAGEIIVISEDGLRFPKGMVTEPLAAALKAGPASIFACGPRPMLAQVAVLAREAGSPAQVSLEAHMACGLGACLSCAVELASSGRDEPVYARACVEGPVFSAEEVRW